MDERPMESEKREPTADWNTVMDWDTVIRNRDICIEGMFHLLAGRSPWQRDEFSYPLEPGRPLRSAFDSLRQDLAVLASMKYIGVRSYTIPWSLLSEKRGRRREKDSVRHESWFVRSAIHNVLDIARYCWREIGEGNPHVRAMINCFGNRVANDLMVWELIEKISDRANELIRILASGPVEKRREAYAGLFYMSPMTIPYLFDALKNGLGDEDARVDMLNLLQDCAENIHPTYTIAHHLLFGAAFFGSTSQDPRVLMPVLRILSRSGFVNYQATALIAWGVIQTSSDEKIRSAAQGIIIEIKDKIEREIISHDVLHVVPELMKRMR